MLQMSSVINIISQDITSSLRISRFDENIIILELITKI
jgi:hypothetical protein